MTRKLLCTFFFLALLVLPPGADAADFCVSDAAALQTALNTASANTEDDVVRVVQGTYYGNFVYTSSQGNALEVRGGFTAGCGGRTLNPANTVLDGQNLDTVLRVTNYNNGSLVVEGFTLQAGDVFGSGGGLCVGQVSDTALSTVGILDNRFLSNQATNGGGLSLDLDFVGTGSPGDVSVARNTFSGNQAFDYAGGVYVQLDMYEATGGAIYFTGNILTGNTAHEGEGAIYLYSYVTSGHGPDLLFTGNTLTGNLSYGYGGGVYLGSVSASGTASSLLLDGETVSGNTAYGAAGGLYLYTQTYQGTTGEIRLTGCTISDNTAYDEAGGLYLYPYATLGTLGPVTVSGNSLTGNTSYNRGGGFYLYAVSNGQSTIPGAVSILDNTIDSNTAYQDGGGGYAYLGSDSTVGAGSLSLARNHCSFNRSYTNGGGLCLEMSGGDGYAFGLDLRGNTFSGNYAGDQAGGVHLRSYCYMNGTLSPIDIRDNLLLGNSAREHYGALFVSSYASNHPGSDLTLVNNVVAENLAEQGGVGGVYCQSNSGSSPGGEMVITNNTITRNASPYVGGLQLSLDDNTAHFYNNIIRGNQSSLAADFYVGGSGTAEAFHNNYTYMMGTWASEGGNFDADPLFRDIGLNDYRLSRGSPCIGAGTRAAPGFPAADIEGRPRGRADVGAYAFPLPILPAILPIILE